MNIDEKRKQYAQYGRTMPFYKGGRGMEVNTLEMDGDLEITSAFECGTGENFIRQGPDHFSVELESDPIPVSEALPVSNICVQVTNYGSTPRLVKLDVVVHPMLREMNWTHFVKADYFIRRGGAWSQMPVDKKICGENIYRLLIDVAPGESVVVSNDMPYPYSQLLVDIERLVRDHPGIVLRRSLGTSVQGRDLPVLTFGERQGAPRLAFAATPQPSEPAGWCVMALADFLAGSDALAQDIRSRFVVDLIPMTVPDGIVAGWRKVNAQGVQPLFEFERAALGKSDCPEAVQEWAWLSQRPPVAFAEIHVVSNRIADRPSQPYLVDRAVYTDEARRRLARRMDLAIVGLDPDGAFRNIEPGDLIWRTLLCFQLVARCDTMAYLFQICGLSLAESRQRAIELLCTMAAVLSSDS